MICQERVLQLIKKPYVSEKTSILAEKNNTIVLKIIKNATKLEIKASVQKLFQVEVESVNTLIVKGKTKRRGHCVGHRSNWKKAYVTLKKGQAPLDLVDNTK